jgi:hypothetical protein
MAKVVKISAGPVAAMVLATAVPGAAFSVPEPGTGFLMFGGLAALALARRRPLPPRSAPRLPVA